MNARLGQLGGSPSGVSVMAGLWINSGHDCRYEEDHDGGMTCPVCGRYEDDDKEDEDGREHD